MRISDWSSDVCSSDLHSAGREAIMAILVRGGTVVNADCSQRADVLIDGGTIRAVGPNLEAPAGAEVIDAGGAFVMPGGIDPHTHMEDRKSTRLNSSH